MKKIIALQDTLLKKSTLDSSGENFFGDKVQVTKGKEYGIERVESAENNHNKVVLSYGAGTWYIYAPHWVIEKGNGKAVDVAVPYLSQRDNRIRPSQTCNMTCAAMVIGFYYPEKLGNNHQLEDVLTQKLTAEKGVDAIYYHANIVAVLEEYGVNSRFSVETSWDAIKKHLGTGNPVIYSGKFTNSGHIIVLRGYDDKGFFVNDPWGEWFPLGYQKRSGEKLHYSYGMMQRLSYAEGGGWAHLCTKRQMSPGSGTGDADIDLGFIKKWEGLRLDAYRCPAGVPTIGYGSTYYLDGTKVKMGDKLKDEKEASALLQNVIAKDFLPELRKIPHWAEMNSDQRTALTSFAFNLGAHFYGNPSFTTITTALKHKHWDKVPSALMLYVKAGGKTLQGLVNRRAEEAALWRQL